MNLNYKSFGQGDPLLVVHGLFGSLDNWGSMSVKLGQHFQVFAVDLRNHGHSPHDDDMSYPVMAGDLSELVRQKGFGHVHVLGHSMGGKVAMEFALRFPSMVDSLIVADIAPRAYPPIHEPILSALLALHPERFQHRKQMEEALASSIPDLALRQFLLKSVERDAEGHFQWRMGLDQIRRNYPDLRSALPGGREFNGPTLFVRGERSNFLLEEDLQLIRPLFPQASLKTITCAGHLIHLENPTAFLDTVVAFLRTVQSPGNNPDLG